MKPDEFQQVFNLPFAGAVEFFRAKLNIPTWVWTDLWKEQHAKGFMSAGAYQADLLNDLRQAVDQAIAGGLSKKDFRLQFRDIASRHGWQYKGGEGWRSSLIWDTNITTAYQAGRWRQFKQSGTQYLIYRHADGIRNPRPLHLAWNGLVLPIEHPFWKTHYPPNGWGCHCRALAADASEYTGQEPPAGWDKRLDTTCAPPGIDAGWDYNVGMADLEHTREILRDKIKGLPPDIGRELLKKLKEEVGEVKLQSMETWTIRNAKPVPGQPKWNSPEVDRLDLRQVDDAMKLPAPGMLPPAGSLEEAVRQVADALGMPAGTGEKTILTPLEEVIIRLENLEHTVEKRNDARERYANYILPTLESPFEVWKVSYDDGTTRNRYIGLFHGERDLMVSVRVEPDGTLFWNFMQESDAGMNRQRVGELVYAKK